MDRVESIEREPHRVRLHELKWVLRLRLNIDSKNIESGKVVSHAGTARTAKQVKQTRTNNRLNRSGNRLAVQAFNLRLCLFAVQSFSPFAARLIGSLF